MCGTPMQGARNISLEIEQAIEERARTSREFSLSSWPRSQLNKLARTLGVPSYRNRERDDLIHAIAQAM